MNPTLKMFVGPMWSSKTTKLLLEIERARYQKKRVALFKPCIDDRYNVSSVVSHSGWSVPATVIKQGYDILDELERLEHPPDIVAVDEAFMLPKVSNAIIWLFRNKVSCIISTLDMSYTCKPFHEVTTIMPWATHIEKCTSVCVICGNDAHYTYKKVVDHDRPELEIDVGGDESYEPRCFEHHPYAVSKE